MNPLNCVEVEARIELYAAHECDAATAAAVASHLARCRTCARAYREVRHLAVLLDLHHGQEQGLARLRARLAAQPRPRARVLPPAVRPLLALAALLLVTLGLVLWAEPRGGPATPSGQDVVVASLAPTARAAQGPEMGPRAVVAMKGAFTVGLDLGGQTPAEFHHRLEEGQRTGRLPPPPEVHLGLELRNRGDRELTLVLKEGKYDFHIDLQGPGVARVRAAGRAEPPLRVPATVRLPPGGTTILPVLRLAEVRGERVSYVYWTEPGRYTLSVRLRAPVRSGAGWEWLTAGTPPLPVVVRQDGR
jgi:hypothetical protein